MEPVLRSVVAVAAVWASFITLHLVMGAVARSVQGRNFYLGEAVILAAFFAAGPILLLKILSAPLHLKIGALAFYWAGCLVYIEVLSLLSRGISLRILLDLLKENGKVNLRGLKTAYGGGMGVRGILDKRLKTLVQFGLVRYEQDQVGPLTLSGRLFAAATSGMRRLLRLEKVG